jgi:hypothetical protein
VPQQKLGSVVPAFDHEGQRMFCAVARRKPALAGVSLHRHPVIGGTNRLRVNIDAEKPVEISEAFGDSGGDDLIEVRRRIRDVVMMRRAWAGANQTGCDGGLR